MLHVGSAGNADGGCFHSRFQSPFYVRSQVFRQHCEHFSKIFRKSKVLRKVWNYYANPNHSELGDHSELSKSLRNFRNYSEISEFFYTWRAAIFRKRSTWCPDRNRDLVLETYVSMLERKIFSNDLRVRYHRNLS